MTPVPVPPQVCHLVGLCSQIRRDGYCRGEREESHKEYSNGDLAGLSAERLAIEDLSVELEKPLGTDEYTCLHWACHYGKAEVIQMEPAS